MRELSGRMVKINERLSQENQFQAKLHGFEVKKQLKQIKHDVNLDQIVRDRINGRINLRNRDKGPA